MAEYIEREAAIEAFSNNGSIFVYGKPKCKAIVSRLNSIPAADVRPVVMCRDCGHWEHERQQIARFGGHKIATCTWWSRNYGTIQTSEGDYCSYGYGMGAE